MIPTAILLPVCIVLAIFSGYIFAERVNSCTAETDCENVYGTTCVSITGCVSKGCACMTGYTKMGPKCVADFGTTCDIDYDCLLVGDETTAGCNNVTLQCACLPNATYNTAYKTCVTTGLEFGSACTAANVDTDCYVGANRFGDCINLVCDCKAGYIKGTGHVCRLPYYGEACTVAAGCQISDASQLGDLDVQAPTCQSLVCACAAADEITTYGGETFCNTIVTTANKIATSLTCTAHNACSSGMCFECPSTSGLICVDSSSSSSMVTIQPALVLLFTFITGMLQL